MSTEFIAPDDAQWVCTPNHLAYKIVGGQLIQWTDSGWDRVSRLSFDGLKKFADMGDPKKPEDAGKYFFDKNAGDPYLLMEVDQ